MSEILTNNKYYKDIADTIRQMKGVATTYKPREMAGALRDMYSTEVEGVPPLTFPSNGNNLLNYRIDGANSEVGDRTANLLDYNWLFDYEQKKVNEYFNYIQITLEPNTTYNVTSDYNYNQAQNATAFIVVNSNTDITTANGGVFGSLIVTTTQDGILKIARRIKGNDETLIPKREDFENNSKYIQISINSVNGVGDRTKNLANSNEMIKGYWAYADGGFVNTNTWICTPKIACKGNVDYTFQFANNSRWYGFVWYDENGNYISTSNVQNGSSTEYRTYTATSPSNARYLIINIAGFPQTTDTISVSDLINFQLEEGPTPTDYEPYGYKIPVVCGGTTTNIYIDEPIGANESKSLSDTNVNIPTINGTNILSIDTTVQPSNVYVQAPKGGSSGGDIDWSAIGFDGMPQAIQDGYDYAIEVKNNWNSSATSLSYKFSNNLNLMFMPLVDTSNATSAGQMFYGCRALITVADLNFNSVTEQGLESLFSGCNSLTNVGEIKVSNITSIKECFKDCTKLKTIPQLNTSNVTNMQGVFAGCQALKTIPQLNTSNVTNMQGVFATCLNLTDLPQLNTSKVTDMYNMFYNCKNLSNNSLDNVLLMCINATSYTGTKTLVQLGFQAIFTPASKIQALPHYQDFLDAGWTIGY